MITKIKDNGSTAVVHFEHEYHDAEGSRVIRESATYAAHGAYVYRLLPKSGALGDQACEGLEMRGPTLMLADGESVGEAIARSVEAAHGYRPEIV